jgi:hypothetical protein
MEIEVSPVTLEQRIEFLKNAAANVEMNKKIFPWTVVIISGLVGAGMCLVVTYWWRRKKDKKK